MGSDVGALWYLVVPCVVGALWKEEGSGRDEGFSHLENIGVLRNNFTPGSCGQHLS